MLLWVLVYQSLFKTWSCGFVTFFGLQASPFQVSEISEKFSNCWHARIYLTDQGDGKNWKAAWSSESGNHILKWPPSCIVSSPAPSHFISTAPLPGVASNSAFPHPPAFPTAPIALRRMLGPEVFLNSWLFFTPPPGESSGKTGSKNLQQLRLS